MAVVLFVVTVVAYQLINVPYDGIALCEPDLSLDREQAVRYLDGGRCRFPCGIGLTSRHGRG